MSALAPDTRKAVAQLEAAIAARAIPQRIAERCEGLIRRLSRPIRVGLIGVEPAQRARLLTALLGDDVLPEGAAWPTVEIGYADAPSTKATLSDGSTFQTEVAASEALMARDPVFLDIKAPLEALRRMSFLFLATGDQADEQAAALRWAARKVDFAIWCTRDFADSEAAIWAAAPPALKNHAYLVAFGPDHAEDLRRRVPEDFQRVLVLPDADDTGASDLQRRLERDIDDALAEDVDAARMLVHRFAGSVETPETGDMPAPVADMSGLVDLLSGPIIYLKRRARDMFETLEWQGEGAEWATEVLENCSETTDELRDFAADWPEDDMRVNGLRGLVDEASDMVTLLQIEGGAQQAQHAAALLLQLRSRFEANLAAPCGPAN